MSLPPLDVDARTFCDLSVDDDGTIYLASQDTEGRALQARLHAQGARGWIRADVPGEVLCPTVSADPLQEVVFANLDAQIYRFSDDLIHEDSFSAATHTGVASVFDLDALGGVLLLTGIDLQPDPGARLWLIDGDDGAEIDDEATYSLYGYAAHLSSTDAARAWIGGEFFGTGHSVITWDVD